MSLWDQLQLPGPCCISVQSLCFASFSLPTRCDSWSNSDRSLEQTSSDDVFVDCLQPPPSGNLGCPSHLSNGSQEAPSTRPQAALIWGRDHFSLPSPETSLNPTIQIDKNQGSLPYGAKELDALASMSPPRPPKPSHLSERRREEQVPRSPARSIRRPECAAVPRRVSLSGLDNVRAEKGK